MKAITKTYLNSRECSVQETVYHNLPELKLKKVSPVIYFLNTNTPEEIVQILLSEEELRKLPNDSPNIF